MRSRPGGKCLDDVMSESGPTIGHLKVLHLEDNPCDAELIQHELETQNLRCVINRVHSEQEFEAALAKGGMDLILSDSQLPGFDTISALTLARERYPEVPFIFVSGTASPNVRGEAFRKGATDFVSKDDLPKLARIIQWMFFHNKRQRHKVALPDVGTPVIVQCKEFRCLGYLDYSGKWREYKRSVELTDVIAWFEI